VEEFATARAQARQDVLEVRGRARRRTERRRIEQAAARGEEDEARETAADLEAARADVLVRQAVAGKVEVGTGEKSWTFQPAAPWGAGDYRVVVDGRLEDVAGNTPLRPFDMDTNTPVVVRPALTLAFRPRAR